MKTKSEYGILKSFLLIFSLIFLALGCGSEKTSDKKEARPPTPQRDEPDTIFDGQYLAVLKPLNTQVTGKLNGAVTISKDNRYVIGDVRVSLGAPGVLHNQYIHVGRSCPTESADTNGDGYIDTIEGSAHYGKVLVPLDADLNSQRSMSGVFPVGDLYGSYIYSEVASYKRFMDDLSEADPIADDDFVKLAPDEGLNLVGRVVIIHGIAKDVPLPETVATRGRYLPQQTLPIACGIFEKVEGVPGEPDDDIADQPLGEAPTGTPTGGTGGDFPEGPTGGSTGGGETEPPHGDETGEVPPTGDPGPGPAPEPVPEPVPEPLPVPGEVPPENGPVAPPVEVGAGGIIIEGAGPT